MSDAGGSANAGAGAGAGGSGSGSGSGSANAGAGARVPRWYDRLAELTGLRVAGWLALVLWGFPELISEPQKLGFHHDEHFFYHHEDVSRTTIARFHQLPAWNPYFCGGIPHIANPQDASLSPDALLRLWLGVEPGRRAAVILFLVLGLEGTYRLARTRNSSPAGATFAASIFALCGWVYSVVNPGWVNMLGIELLPWAVLGLERALRDARWVPVAGAAVGWMFLCAGTYTTPFAVLALLAVTADQTVRLATARPEDREAPWWRPAAVLAAAGACAVVLAAGKLLPTLAVVLHYPRIWQGTESNHVADLLEALADPTSNAIIDMRVGRAAVLLALAGPALGNRKDARDSLLALLFFAFAMGNFAPYAPFTLLQKLPVFSQLRAPHRLLVVCAFFVALGAGRTVSILEDNTARALRALFDWLEARAASLGPRGRGSAPAPVLPPEVKPALSLLAGVAGTALVLYLFVPVAKDVIQENHLATNMFRIDPPASVPDAPFRQARGNRWDAEVWVPAQRGSLHCMEETPFPQSPALRADLPAEEYPADPSAATVTRLSWSPNEIVLRVRAARETVVVVNQNHARPWRASVGEVLNHNGLLAVRVPPGEHTLTLRYRDPLVLAGAALSLLAWLALLAFAARETHRAARNALARWKTLPWLDAG